MTTFEQDRRGGIDRAYFVALRRLIDATVRECVPYSPAVELEELPLVCKRGHDPAFERFKSSSRYRVHPVYGVRGYVYCAECDRLSRKSKRASS